jgi:hypothetical protein
MTPSASPRRLPGSLARVVLVVRALCVLGALSLIAVPLWFWASPEAIESLAPSMVGVTEMRIDARAQWLGGALSLLPVSLGLYALWQLWRLFTEYAAGRVFGRTALVHLRRFAWALLGTALLAPLVRAATSVALTLGNPPGRRLLVVGFSWNDYMAVLLAAVLIAIATVMAEAVRVAEENEGFV